MKLRRITFKTYNLYTYHFHALENLSKEGLIEIIVLMGPNLAIRRFYQDGRKNTVFSPNMIFHYYSKEYDYDWAVNGKEFATTEPIS